MKHEVHETCDTAGCTNPSEYGGHGFRDQEVYSVYLCRACYTGRHVPAAPVRVEKIPPPKVKLETKIPEVEKPPSWRPGWPG